jgi:prepilin-type N-terminal cleavage/methylation domain-containing protein
LQKKGVTLIEFLIVIIIIGILVILSLPQYSQIRERAFDREAKANLRLIQAAERFYRLELGCYYASTDTGDMNTNLKLSLPSTTNRRWSYSTKANNCSQADRYPGSERHWRLQDNEKEPAEGTCP